MEQEGMEPQGSPNAACREWRDANTLPGQPWRFHFFLSVLTSMLGRLWKSPECWTCGSAGVLGLSLGDPELDGQTDGRAPSPKLRGGPSPTSPEWHHSQEVPSPSCCSQKGKGRKGFFKVTSLLFLDAFPRGWSRPRLELLKFSVLCLFN